MFLNNNSPFSPFPCALSGDAAFLSSLLPPAAVVPRLLFATEAAKQSHANKKYATRVREQALLTKHKYASHSETRQKLQKP